MQTTFSTPPILSSRFTTSPAAQYYSELPSLQHLSRIVQHTCRPENGYCQTLASSIITAKYLDIDYDAIQHSLVATAYWDKPPTNTAWSDDIVQPPGRDHRVEVGVLSKEQAVDPELGDMTLGGVLTVLGEDIQPSKLARSLIAHSVH